MPYPTLAFPLLILITEYGFQTRKAAMRGFSSARHRPALRLGGWLLIALVLRAWRAPLHLGVLAAGLVLGEVTVFLLRRVVHRQVGRGLAHGSPVAHLTPLIASVVFGSLVYGLQSILHSEALITQRGLSTALAITLTFTALWCWSTLVTVSLVDLVRPGQVRDDITPSLGAGELIGLLERLVVFGLVLAGALGAVGLVIAAKSAARFPQFKEEAFAEYFLIGTLSSVGMATLLAVILPHLL